MAPTEDTDKKQAYIMSYGGERGHTENSLKWIALNMISSFFFIISDIVSYFCDIEGYTKDKT